MTQIEKLRHVAAYRYQLAPAMQQTHASLNSAGLIRVYACEHRGGSVQQSAMNTYAGMARIEVRGLLPTDEKKSLPYPIEAIPYPSTQNTPLGLTLPHRRPGGGGGGRENNPPPPPEGLSDPSRFVLPPCLPTFFPSLPGILIVNVCPSFNE